MRVPESPPSTDKILKRLFEEDNKEKIVHILSANQGLLDNKGRYLHWTKLKHLPPPEDLSSEEYWFIVKTARQKVLKNIPLYDKAGRPFNFCIPDSLQEDLHWLDQNAAGSITMDQPITNPHTRDTYLVSSLIEESINSSQLEGASTTRDVAKEMLRQGRKPKDHSEQMIFNNYKAMEVIREYKDDALTPSLIKYFHEVITKSTLDDPAKAGQYRDANDKIHVVDATESSILHTPPDAEQLPERIDRICDFANNSLKNEFIHPAIKAIILHFMIGYDHPFIDGNGRTARALFYWAMAKYGYWLIEFISISRIIKKAPVQYGNAYLYSETDDGDLTYFLIHQMNVIREGIASLHKYLERKANEIEEAEKLLDKSKARGQLNHRQLSLLKHALKNPNAIYRIQEHQASHAISYQTARTDLLKMSDQLHLLRKRKYGNSFVFVSPPDLKTRLIENKL
ncbi:Fic family protein [Methylomarinum sp. Ch1-1]|uniref:Fic family protein n=1 Tax=Methylomarinum roseum TaxID=3067653 RepID=A0AAU7NZ25_9GAMM|nr:Fic family protein [Methylomarinum sp. Ch1-1]MDP4521681.1 Fic family protein [Methylomarinum sp. Ch1-1]